MNTLLLIMGIASMAIIFVREFGYKLKYKPFTCELCMAFWLTSIYFHSVDGIIYGFLAGATATILNRYI